MINALVSQEAVKALPEQVAQAAAGKYRLSYHVMPPSGWMNDPNGFIQYKGTYHLFYQYWPYGPEWGPMHWGHATSSDLLRWEHMEPALVPTEPYESKGGFEGFGCFSGSAIIDDDGNLALLYTGHVDGRDPVECQNLAISADGTSFQKSSANPVILGPAPDGGPEFRDPKFFLYCDRVFTVIGSTKEGVGRALLFETNLSDLTKWQYRGVLAEATGLQGTMWECPDIFSLEDSHVLVVSPMQGKINSKPIALIGAFDESTLKFTASKEQILDNGVDFYAPQTLVDSQGRRILIGWMQQWHQKNVTASEGWSGAMTLPRELTIRSGRVCQFPVEETKSLRGKETELACDTILARDTKIGMDIDPRSEIHLRAKVRAGRGFCVALLTSADGSEKTTFTIDTANQRVTCDRSLSGQGEATSSTAPLIAHQGDVTLDFFVDSSSIELFINEGTSVLTNRVFPEGGDARLEIGAIGGSDVLIETATAWGLEQVS